MFLCARRLASRQRANARGVMTPCNHAGGIFEAIDDAAIRHEETTMRSLLWLLLAFSAACPPANAQECPDTASYAKAREIIRDLERIPGPDGIQESYKTRIGGIDQWLNVRGQDKANPVILFIHGGPASPLTPTLWQFQRPIEDYFTIVNYDQRGAGKTFGEGDPDAIADTIHIERYVDDAIEIAEYVRKRYHKDKLILMAHSWGTVVGMNAALKRPDLFHAYVGIGQVINSARTSGSASSMGLRRPGRTTIRRPSPNSSPLPRIRATSPSTRERIIIARKWPQFYGGLSAYREDSAYYFDAPKLSPEYDHDDTCAIDRGNVFTLGRILPDSSTSTSQACTRFRSRW